MSRRTTSLVQNKPNQYDCELKKSANSKSKANIPFMYFQLRINAASIALGYQQPPETSYNPAETNISINGNPLFLA